MLPVFSMTNSCDMALIGLAGAPLPTNNVLVGALILGNTVSAVCAPRRGNAGLEGTLMRVLPGAPRLGNTGTGVGGKGAGGSFLRFGFSFFSDEAEFQH